MLKFDKIINVWQVQLKIKNKKRYQRKINKIRNKEADTAF